MKKVILGSLMFLAGLLSSALLLAGSMANTWTINGKMSSMWNISQYGLMPALYCFVAVVVIGLIIAIWGLLEKK
jgi:hypothetical protein